MTDKEDYLLVEVSSIIASRRFVPDYYSGVGFAGYQFREIDPITKNSKTCFRYVDCVLEKSVRESNSEVYGFILKEECEEIGKPSLKNVIISAVFVPSKEEESLEGKLQEICIRLVGEDRMRKIGEWESQGVFIRPGPNKYPEDQYYGDVEYKGENGR